MGRAPHWRLTEVGYMKEQPTKDFLKWDGTPFREIPRPAKADKSLAYCEGCGVEFKRKRKDAKFCSCSCRQKAHRERQGSVVDRSRYGKRFPVGESPHTYVGESPHRGVGESPHTVTDKRGGKSPHKRRIGVGEITDISSIPSSRAPALRPDRETGLPDSPSLTRQPSSGDRRSALTRRQGNPTEQP
jgi:hypothetical protein